MPQLWPTSTIRELLALAEAAGESRAILESAEDARLFRFAIYSFRKTHDIGADLSITLEDNTVVVHKRPAHVVVLANETDSPSCSE